MSGINKEALLAEKKRLKSQQNNKGYFSHKGIPENGTIYFRLAPVPDDMDGKNFRMAIKHVSAYDAKTQKYCLSYDEFKGLYSRASIDEVDIVDNMLREAKANDNTADMADKFKTEVEYLYPIYMLTKHETTGQFVLDEPNRKGVILGVSSFIHQQIVNMLTDDDNDGLELTAVENGGIFKISKTGKGLQTKYELTVLNKKTHTLPKDLQNPDQSPSVFEYLDKVLLSNEEIKELMTGLLYGPEEIGDEVEETTAKRTTPKALAPTTNVANKFKTNRPAPSDDDE